MIYIVFYNYYEDSQIQLVTENLDKTISEYIEKEENDIYIWEDEKMILSYGDLERHEHYNADRIKHEILTELSKIKGCGQE